MKKNSLYNNLKQKVKNSNYNFSGNFLYHLIAPLVIIVLGLILGLSINFNLGLDFKGGTVATVVVSEDISVSENYKNVKTKIDNVLNKNDVDGLIYQKVETSYYGNAVTVKFNRVSDELKETLRNDLIESFYSTIEDENELQIFVKVDNFDANVPSGVILSTALAILVMIIAVFIYIASRFGISAGFVSGMICILDLITLVGLIAITRIQLDISIMSAFVLTAMYSLICSAILFSKVNENFKKEIYAKYTNAQIVNISVKDVLVVNTSLAIFLLLIAFFMGIVPTTIVRNTSLPVMLGVLISYYSSMFITPGLWSRTYIKRRRKEKVKTEDNNKTTKNLTQEEIIKEPDVIVETEAKE